MLAMLECYCGGRQDGLIIAEVELERECGPVTLPDRLDREISCDSRCCIFALAYADVPAKPCLSSGDF